jgi:hypothetical protein
MKKTYPPNKEPLSSRIPVMVSEREKLEYEQAAINDGLNLSQWVRQACRDAVARNKPTAHLISAAPDLLFIAMEYRETVKLCADNWKGDLQGKINENIKLILIDQCIAKAKGKPYKPEP